MEATSLRIPSSTVLTSVQPAEAKRGCVGCILDLVCSIARLIFCCLSRAHSGSTAHPLEGRVTSSQGERALKEACKEAPTTRLQGKKDASNLHQVTEVGSFVKPDGAFDVVTILSTYLKDMARGVELVDSN